MEDKRVIKLEKIVWEDETEQNGLSFWIPIEFSHEWNEFTGKLGRMATHRQASDWLDAIMRKHKGI